jgi:hypothetical protein
MCARNYSLNITRQPDASILGTVSVVRPTGNGLLGNVKRLSIRTTPRFPEADLWLIPISGLPVIRQERKSRIARITSAMPTYQD